MSENKNKSVFKKNLILMLVIFLIGVAPLLFIKSEFGGSDGEGEEVIKTIIKSRIKIFEKPVVTKLCKNPGHFSVILPAQIILTCSKMPNIATNTSP